LIIRIPYLINPFEVLTPELNLILVGRKIFNGFVMYRDVYDVSAPLSSFTYSFFHIFSGKSVWGYRIFAFILVVFQCALLNRYFIKNNSFLEKGFVPAIVYGVLLSLVFDMMYLSEVLMGITFILFSLDFLFRLLDKGLADKHLFNMGFHIGIAGLFYQPLFLFIMLPLAVIILYVNSNFRKILLVLFGFCFPVVICAIGFSLLGGFNQFIYPFFDGLSLVSRLQYATVKGFLILFGFPTFLLLMGVFSVLSAGKFINYQQRTQQAMFLYLVCGLISIFFAPSFSLYHFIVFAPAFAFFISHYLLLIKKKWMAATTFLLFLIVLPALGFLIYKNVLSPESYSVRTLIVADSSIKLKDKRILVLGNHPEHYKENEVASPYLNWPIAQKHFNNLNQYESSIIIYNNLLNDLPDYIIDEAGLTTKLFSRMPELGKKYVKSEGKIYELRK